MSDKVQFETHIPVDVALKCGDAERAVIEVVEFSGGAIEAPGRDKAEEVKSPGAADSIDSAEVDVVDAGREIRNAIMLPGGGRAVSKVKRERVAAAAAGQIVNAGAADQCLYHLNPFEGGLAMAALHASELGAHLGSRMRRGNRQSWG